MALQNKDYEESVGTKKKKDLELFEKHCNQEKHKCFDHDLGFYDQPPYYKMFIQYFKELYYPQTFSTTIHFYSGVSDEMRALVTNAETCCLGNISF